MLVHSRLYYKMSESFISDWQWQLWANELVKLQQEYPEISKQVEWYEAFEDWDGSTGAFLPLKHPWVVNKARYLLMIEERFTK